MSDIKPVIKELKEKLPTKEELLESIAALNLPIDADKISRSPIIQSFLKHDLTEQALLKLKEVMPNEEALDKIDAIRKAYIIKDEN